MSKEEDIMESVAELQKSVVPEELISDTDAQEYIKWVLGLVQEPPSSLERLINNLSNKLNMGMAHILAMNMQRSNKLVSYMRAAEDVLFDEKNILNKDEDAIKELYDKASKTLNSTLEFTRKYVSQNKDNLKAGGESDKIKDMLLTLPQSKLENIAKKLENGEL